MIHFSLGPLSLTNCQKEQRCGLASTFFIQCPMCGYINHVKTSREHRTGKRGPKSFDTNSRVVLGCLHAGIGQTHINNLLATANIPGLTNNTFKYREREVGVAIEKVAKTSCKQVINDEKMIALRNGIQPDENNLLPIACSFDMGWQKRGKGHNSNTGQAAAMSMTSGKVMDYTTRVKTCRFCDHAKAKKITAKPHDCRKNHSASSKAMEPDSAVEMFNNAPQENMKFATYTGDDDSTTEAHIRQKVSYNVEKLSDIVHTKRSLTTRLYNLSQRAKFPNSSVLSQKVINYLVKCFAYGIAQNKGNPKKIQNAIRNVIPHAFGKHDNCNTTWCHFKDDPSKYKHKSLPYGKDLYGNKLETALQQIFNDYSTDIVAEKLAPLTNSQRNESLNGVIGSKIPKIRFYGGSESNDFRVACGVAQTNLRYNYINKTLEALNIEPGQFCEKFNERMTQKLNHDKTRK